ncbi:hypothetical protein Sjap_025835 [Stephania japonica]|uniref:Uncharacterized protein n=1 Tax=Stephania japonica TaxID=461633 RepID=A0AAP0HFZ6_9MAGN
MQSSNTSTTNQTKLQAPHSHVPMAKATMFPSLFPPKPNPSLNNIISTPNSSHSFPSTSPKSTATRSALILVRRPLLEGRSSRCRHGPPRAPTPTPPPLFQPPFHFLRFLRPKNRSQIWRQIGVVCHPLSPRHCILTPKPFIEKGSFTENELLFPPPSHSLRLPKFKLGSLMNLFHQFGLDKLTFAERFSIAIKECDAISYRTCREIEGPFIDYIGSLYK